MCISLNIASTRYISYNATAKAKAASKAKEALTTFPAAPLAFTVELDVELEEVPDVFDEEVFVAVPFEKPVAEEVVNVVPAEVVPVVEKVAEGVDWMTAELDTDPEALVETVPLAVAEPEDVVALIETPELELELVSEPIAVPPVMWNGNEDWKVFAESESSVRFNP